MDRLTRTCRHTRRLVCLLAIIWLNAPAHAAIRAAVDGNGDGSIIFDTGHGDLSTTDQTQADQPFAFWLNTDQDDIELYETWPIDRPDHRDASIGSLRDMEDLARLHILNNNWQKTIETGNNQLRFRWETPTGSPGIRLWLSHANVCGRGYLLDAAQATAQLNGEDYLVGIVNEQNLRLPLHRLAGSSFARDRLCLLFEGVSAGAGKLVIELLDNDSDIIARDAVHLDLRNIKTFYERVGLNWPGELKNPWDYREQPPAPDLEPVPEPMGHEFKPAWNEEEDIIVWVHGWIPQDPENYRRTLVFSFETMWKRFWHQGFRGRIVHFRWPSEKRREMFGLLESDYRGYKSAAALVSYAHKLAENRPVHVTTHSLGGTVLMEALRLGLEVENALFQVSAVPAEAFDDSEILIEPELTGTPIPRMAEDGGFAGYLSDTKTRIYNIYNPADITWLGWNMVQTSLKPTGSITKSYKYVVNREPDDRMRLRYWWLYSRPVEDRHEQLAMIVPSRSQALGGEGRVGGVVHESFNINQAPFEYGTDHVAMWRWNTQQVLPYFNLMLDIFNLPYNSLRAGSD